MHVHVSILDMLACMYMLQGPIPASIHVHVCYTIPHVFIQMALQSNLLVCLFFTCLWGLLSTLVFYACFHEAR